MTNQSIYQFNSVSMPDMKTLTCTIVIDNGHPPVQPLKIVLLWIWKADNHALNELLQVFLWVCSAVHSTCKDYGEESHGWSYLCKPSGRNTLAAAFRPRLALELGIHCLNVISIVLRWVLCVYTQLPLWAYCDNALPYCCFLLSTQMPYLHLT
ncbi:hypothetical protein YC2023_033708 [Brassica napus]